jgi:hypothetical protein
MVTIYISANAYIVDSFPRYVASSIAAKTFVRSLIGASVPLWINQSTFPSIYNCSGSLARSLKIYANFESVSHLDATLGWLASGICLARDGSEYVFQQHFFM